LRSRKDIYFPFFLFAVVPFLFFPQHRLQIINTDKSPVFSKLKYPQNFSSREGPAKEARKLVLALQEEGYLLASADSSVSDSLNYILYLNIGKQYRFAELKKGNAESSLLAGINYSERFYSERNFKPAEVKKLFEKILVYYENHGYPFAAARLDSIQIKENSIAAVLNISKHRLIKIDSVILQGDLKISNSFLYHYLDVKPGALYNESAIRNISSKIRQLPFAKEKRELVVRLTETRNKIYIFADKRNASQFDGIIGLLPTPGGKTVFTGDAKIKLQNNVFKTGETLELNWRRLQSQTQDLRTRMVFPYIFRTFAGAEHVLKLYRRDTTFIDVLNTIAIQYIFKGLNNIKGFYRQRNSNLLSTTALVSSTTLPDYADIVTRSYGLGFVYERLDYKMNPRKGISISLNSSAGTRQIKKNAKLNEIIYNGINLNSSQYQGEMEVAGYIPLFTKGTIKIATQAATVISDQVFRNELFRIGGLRTLRGFDEESIFASTYAIGTLEYRYLFEENSAIFLFCDAAWYEKTFVGDYLSDVPLGIGAGISFETKAGIFSLNYALGKQLNNTFDVRSGKIHFGIVNTF
jgi:outer membrane protein assembly factor BamA